MTKIVVTGVLSVSPFLRIGRGLKILAASFLASGLVAASAAQAISANPPMVTKNSDGTFIVQKEPQKDNSKGSKAKQGLVIPPQVVVPLVPADKPNR